MDQEPSAPAEYEYDEDLDFTFPAEPVFDTPFKGKNVAFSGCCVNVSRGTFLRLCPYIGAACQKDVTGDTDIFVIPSPGRRVPRRVFKTHKTLKAEYFAARGSVEIITEDVFFGLLGPKLTSAMMEAAAMPDFRPAALYSLLLKDD